MTGVNPYTNGPSPKSGLNKKHLVSARSATSGKSAKSKTSVKSSYSQFGLKKNEKALVPLTAEIIKNEMLNAFSMLQIDTYSDILRIKKPQS